MLRFFAAVFACVAILALVAAAGTIYVFDHYGHDLPDHTQLASYEPPVTSRVYSGNGRLLAEYATEKRVFVPVDAIPKPVIEAFLAAEDKNFYTHPGVDIIGIGRAILTNISHFGTDRRPVGASTITQQVAKNFLLSNEVSITRKIKEAILAFRIDRAFSKNRILELYLNEIYLGYGSYGVAAAALNYFNKALDELSTEEIAFLASLPKAPNNYDPARFPEAALARRNWVLTRMQEEGFLSADETARAQAAPLDVRPRQATERVAADYFAEEVRREVVRAYGEQALYQGGLAVRATVDPEMQALAEKALAAGLEDYDRRHGWRGAITHIGPDGGSRLPDDWRDRLAEVPPPPGLGSWRLAVVSDLGARGASLAFVDEATGIIPMSELAWARPWKEGQSVGDKPKKAADVLSVGDVVAVAALDAATEAGSDRDPAYALKQLPAVDGALVAMDPHTGRVLAMAGGYSYARSQFNRATQANRQTGSAFKPVVYLCAMENGLTPASIILDAPFIIDQGPGLPPWNPSNYTDRYYGPTTIRTGLEQSRNVMTVRLAETIGMDKVADCARRLQLFDNLPPYLSYALGAGETTLIRLTTAYAMLVNGGKALTATLIDRIQDRYGKTIYRHDDRDCPGCNATVWADQAVPVLPDTSAEVTDPASAYQIVSMLEGVVQRGTGKTVSSVGKPLAGKTGTTNEARDAWFVGFSPDLAVGVFVGFDEPTPLGHKEAGASVAAPIFRDFMKEALADKPATPFRIPPGIRLVRINAETGELARAGDRKVILEAFKPGTEPRPVPEDAPTAAGAGAGRLLTGTGGLY
ncbi:MAG: penicillin-binding protein 1A [Rhodospirillales bacterium]|nr:penicillin-binding protein 1A [Rhodospirillales bacterium]